MLAAPDISSLGPIAFTLLLVAGVVSGSIIVPPTEESGQQSVETVDTPTQQPTTTTESDSSSDQRTAGVVTVISVTDGDTVDVRMPDGTTETIRLLGVDAPETTSNDTEPGEWRDIPDTADGRQWLATWGDKATTYAKDRLAGKEIYIQTDPQADRRDSYGRILVYAYQSESSETSFNRRLLRDGYARYYDSTFSKSGGFKGAEIMAQSDDKGVWGFEATSTTESDSGGSGTGNLVVAEVHADADGNDHDNLDDEYIVLRNDGSESLDMGGWSLSDSADHTYHFPTGFTLGPGETVTVYTGSGSDSDTELYWGSDSAVWNNGGDTIIVVTNDGETVVKYEY